MNRILVSSCLLGFRVRYDGADFPCDRTILHQWQDEGRLVHFCPEQAGGFPTPRPPAETVGGDGTLVLLGEAKVMEDTGLDVTAMFLDGAKKTLDFAKAMNVKIAIMPNGSPSCGVNIVYDGSFSGKKIAGDGVTVGILEKNGIRVFDENQIEDALALLKSMDESEAGEEAL